ncbi:RNA polymerase sigma factor [Candidatus Fermentibacteria bacterium]|nr:RNA polymerase sigma factor [Candidatus Fermentibacteria bacterium]
MDRDQERRLVKAARKNPEAFGALYDEYAGRILSYTYRLLGSFADAEEATSETFYKAILGIGRFRWRPCGFLPWLYRIASNESVNVQRRRAKGAESPLFERLPGPVRDELEQKETVESGHELAKALARALAQLDPRDRQIVTLHYFQGETYALIARSTGVKESALRVRAMRALRRLEQILEKEGWNHGRAHDAGWAAGVDGCAEVPGVPETAAHL